MSQAAIYMRGITRSQVVGHLSIPDQRASVMRHAAAKSNEVVGEYVEAKSFMTGDRRELTRMLDFAKSGRADINVILVHSFNRFYRDAVEGEFEIRTLKKRGITVEGATQPIDEVSYRKKLRRELSIVFVKVEK